MTVERLNFHHLRYFWAVAKEGHLTHTAKRLRVSQSALSAQIRQLEEQLGQALFVREGRRLMLTEAGRIALAHAEEIFESGRQLVSTLERGRQHDQTIRIGAVATLSRNFQESFVEPLLREANVTLQLQSGTLDELLLRLESHDVDLVLSNRAPPRAPGRAWRSRRIARQRVSLVGRQRRRSFRFPDDLRGALMIVPGTESEIRTEFDAVCEQLQITVRILAEVDDMATMRLLSLNTDAIALLPSVVVRDELRSRVLYEYGVVPGLRESFYAITVARRYPHPLVRSLLARDEQEILAMRAEPPKKRSR